MNDQKLSHRETEETEERPEARKSPYNINGPRTADPEDYDENGNKVADPKD